MLQTGPSNSPPDEHWRIVSQLIRSVLSDSVPGAAYRQQLLQALDRWAEPDTGALTISALPKLTCQASGGDPHRAAPVATAWQLMRLAAKLLDDVEDGEASRQPTEAINLAIGLLFVAQLVLDELPERGVPPGHARRLCQAFHRTVLRACAGQHADLVAGQAGITKADPDAWLEIAGAKSGELLAWAAWAGALIAGADEHTLACYREYGYRLGVLLQVADDFNGVWCLDGTSDLAAGRPTLPVCYALLVARPKQQECLIALLKQASQGSGAAEAQARQLLTDLGAQSYLLVVGRVQYQQAVAALRNAHCISQANHLIGLLDRVLPAPSCVEG